MKYLLTFDVGTTAMKCTLFDIFFNKIAFVSREYRLFTPENDIVELPAETYWKTFTECVGIIISSGTKAEDIISVTFTTQGETLIPVDKSLSPLRNAIVWIDARASTEAENISSLIPQREFYSHTGLSGINGALPLAKLMWIKKNQPDVYKNTYKFLLLEDYLIARLTGRTVSEKSLLSSTGWFDINREEYFLPLLSSYGIDKEKLPDILPCGYNVGCITHLASIETGLSKATCVTTGAMDQIASAIGAGNIKPGIVTETTGTALVVGATSESVDYSNAEMLTVYKHFDNKFLYMPYCNTAGIVLKWFKDNFLEELTERAKMENRKVYSLIDELASLSPAGSEGLILLPHFAGKGVPGEIPSAKGVLFGLTLATQKGDVIRSILEGVGYMLNETLISLEKSGVGIGEVRSLGGGSYSDVWSGIKADICGKKFIRMNEPESTSLGAAILGYAASDKNLSVEQLAEKHVQISSGNLPDPKNHEVYKSSFAKYMSLYNALKNEF